MRKDEDLKAEGKVSGLKFRPRGKKPLADLENALLVGLILFIAVSHLSLFVHGGALWRDEVLTLNTATMSTLGGVWDKLYCDSFPAFFPFIVRAWTGMFTCAADWPCRLLGMLIGLGCCGALFLNARLLAGSLPFLSMALFSLNAITIRYGDSLRAYGLGTLLMLVALGCFWRVATAPTRLNVLLAALLAILSVQTLYQNAFIVGAMCVGGVCLNLRPFNPWRIAILIGIGTAAALSYLPYMPIMERMATFKELRQVPAMWSLVWHALSQALSSGHQLSLFLWLLLPALAMAGAAAAYFFTGLIADAKQRSLLLFSAVTMLVGVIGFAVFLSILRFRTESWYYILPLALVGSCLDLISVAFVRSTTSRVVRLVVVIALVLVSAQIVWGFTLLRFTNLDSIAGYLDTQADPQDLILVQPWYAGITFDRYYHGLAHWTTIPPLEDQHSQRFDLLKVRMAEAEPNAAVFRLIQNTLQSGHQVWWVGQIVAPQPGQHLPPLPPAPHPDSGWYSGPYIQHWALQTGDLIQSHATSVQLISLPAIDPVDPVEAGQLLVAEGWQ